MMISSLSKPTSFSPRFSGVPQQVKEYLKDYDNLKNNASGDDSAASIVWTRLYSKIPPFKFETFKDRIDTLRHLINNNYPLGVTKVLMGDNHPYETLSTINSYYDSDGKQIKSFDPAKIVDDKKGGLSKYVYNDSGEETKKTKKKKSENPFNSTEKIKKPSKNAYTEENFKALANYFQQYPEVPSVDTEYKIAGKIISLKAMSSWHTLWLDAGKPSSDAFAKMLMK